MNAVYLDTVHLMNSCDAPRLCVYLQVKEQYASVKDYLEISLLGATPRTGGVGK